MTPPSLVLSAGIIALLAGGIGYFIGGRKEAKWRGYAIWWREHASDYRRLCEQRGKHVRQALELLDRARRNASQTREMFMELLPPGISEKIKRLDEEIDAKLEEAKKAEADKMYEFPSELDIE